MYKIKLLPSALLITAISCWTQLIDINPAYSANVDIMKFGAKGDGKTDDSQAFQNAIAAAGADGTVYCPDPAHDKKSKGQYLHKEVIDLNGVTLSGDGLNSQIIAGKDAGTIKLTGDHAAVMNLSITYSSKVGGRAGQMTGSCVWAHAATHFTVQGCTLTNSPSGPVMYIEQSANGTISKNNINGGAEGFYLVEVNNLTFDSNKIRGDGPAVYQRCNSTQIVSNNINFTNNDIAGNFSNDSLAWTAIHQLTVANNTITNTYWGPVGGRITVISYNSQIWGPASNVTIDHNTLTGVGNGYGVRGFADGAINIDAWFRADKITITNNTFNSIARGCISCEGGNLPGINLITNLNIASNKIINCGVFNLNLGGNHYYYTQDPAISVHNASNVSVCKNVVNGYTGAAISVAQDCGGTINISSNNLSNCGSSVTTKAALSLGETEIPLGSMETASSPKPNAAVTKVTIMDNSYSGAIGMLSYFVDDQVSRAKVSTTASGNTTATLASYYAP